MRCPRRDSRDGPSAPDGALGQMTQLRHLRRARGVSDETARSGSSGADESVGSGLVGSVECVAHGTGGDTSGCSAWRSYNSTVMELFLLRVRCAYGAVSDLPVICQTRELEG